MKKFLVLILGLILAISVLACSSEEQTTTDDTDTQQSEQAFSTDDFPLTNEQAEQVAAQELYKHLKKYYQRANVDATKYSIGSITEEPLGESATMWFVRGKFYLYDFYGDAYSDSTFPGTFMVSIPPYPYEREVSIT